MAADIAQFAWDLATDRWWWSDGMYTALGYAPQEVEAGSIACWPSSIRRTATAREQPW